jgi:hypothetical protein
MQVFDASSIIYAWDTYPVRQIPGLWDWMSVQIADGKLVMPSVAFEEVNNKAPECGAWLKDNNLPILEIDNAILHGAIHIKNLLGIVGDKYGAGVGENDLLIISAAKSHQAELVTDESWQPALPKNLLNCKIPAVCSMNGVAVPWINYLNYIKRSNAVFR